MNMFIELSFHSHVNSITIMVWSSACSGAETKADTEGKASFIIVSGLYPALHAFNMVCSKRSNPYVVQVMRPSVLRLTVTSVLRVGRSHFGVEAQARRSGPSFVVHRLATT